MGKSGGISQLVMSMALVLVGCCLFLVGLGSSSWVLDKGRGYSMHCGLWETCSDGGNSSGCSAILPGSAKAYMEVTRTVQCLALVVHTAVLCTCFLADDRPASFSCAVCCLRYGHVAAVFTAGGLSFLAILIFAGCYKNDDWFVKPVLGYSYWLALAGCIVTVAGGVMRVVFIKWPDRPGLPASVSDKETAPQAPQKRRARTRVDNALGAEPLPVALRPGKNSGASSKTGLKRLFAVFYRTKTKPSRVDIGTISEALQQKYHQGAGGPPDGGEERWGDGKIAKDSVTGGSKGTMCQSWTETGYASDTDSGDRRRRKRGGRGRRRTLSPISRYQRNRGRAVEPFVGYNIPPTPAPDPPDLEDCYLDDQEDGAAPDTCSPDVKRYQQVVGSDDLSARVVRTPPPVVYPSPAPGQQETQQYLVAKELMDKRRSSK